MRGAGVLDKLDFMPCDLKSISLCMPESFDGCSTVGSSGARDRGASLASVKHAVPKSVLLELRETRS